jgi:hypothetical protein
LPSGESFGLVYYGIMLNMLHTYSYRLARETFGEVGLMNLKTDEKELQLRNMTLGRSRVDELES